MFKITLSPQSSSFIDNKHTNISVDGSKIIYDGEEYDFSLMPDNSQVEAVFPAEDVIKNIDGVIHITLHYKYNSNFADFYQSTDIEDYIFDIESGEVPCPIKWREFNEVDMEQPTPEEAEAFIINLEESGNV